MNPIMNHAKRKIERKNINLFLDTVRQFNVLSAQERTFRFYIESLLSDALFDNNNNSFNSVLIGHLKQCVRAEESKLQRLVDRCSLLTRIKMDTSGYTSPQHRDMVEEVVRTLNEEMFMYGHITPGRLVLAIAFAYFYIHKNGNNIFVKQDLINMFSRCIASQWNCLYHVKSDPWNAFIKFLTKDKFTTCTLTEHVY